MLEIQDLHVSVHGTPVLKGIDLKVEAGETFILFGPNGSGKTTLLMTLMGFSGYEVTRGKIIFKGHDITYAPMYERARLGIGAAEGERVLKRTFRVAFIKIAAFQVFPHAGGGLYLLRITAGLVRAFAERGDVSVEPLEGHAGD